MSDAPQEPVNILLVDDQPARLLSYEVILAGLGENLVRANSGVEALQKLMKDEFAVVLLDVSMPGMDGYEAASIMREHPRVARTPIIFVTAFHISDLDRLRGYEVGAVDYVYVPVVPEVLRGKVAVLVELYRQRRELLRLNRTLAQANEDLARANSTLQAEKARELEKLNLILKGVNARLAHANVSLKDEVETRARLEEALRDTDRRKDEFLAMLAHELRNPLAPILNAVHVMRADDGDAAALAGCRDVIERQVEHLTRLVDDLLDVARITQGKLRVAPEPVTLAAIVARAVETSRPVLEAASQSLTIALPAQSVPLNVDPVRMAQVLSNLLHNAAKYSEPGGRVQLAASCPAPADGAGREVVIRVTDSGIGIAPETLPRVFEPFMQADRSITRSRGGLGVGLTLVKRIVEMHDGSVEAASAGTGSGSEFLIRLPVAQAAAAQAARPSEPPESRAPAVMRRRVLVVDDNEASAHTMTLLLRKLGHEVATAYDGAGAVEAARTFRPDLALLDIGLPIMDGYEVARRIRVLPGGDAIALVALTGWGMDEDRRRSRDAGFDEHIVKPVDRATLQRVLSLATARAKETAVESAPPSPRSGTPE